MGGLLLLVIGAIPILALVVWVAWGVAHGFRSVIGRLIVASLVLGFFYWVLFGRSMLGKREFERLCAAEAGYKVYKSVELPEKYFDKYGNPDFEISKKPGVLAEVTGKYVAIDTFEDVSPQYTITKRVITYKDYESSEILGVATTFFFGGAYSFPVPGHVSGRECPQTISTGERPLMESFRKKLFIKTH